MTIKDYLTGVSAPPELLGLIPLLNPFAAFTSSQRGMMFSSHAEQAQILNGCEHPKIMSGFESKFGEYEYNTTTRNQDCQLREIIPKFVINAGAQPVKSNPFYIITYQGANDKKVGYFELNKFTMRSSGYGYPNQWVNSHHLNKGNYIPKDLPLCTSPAHSGNKYMLGTNLNTVYLSLPGVTEDAFIISESAAAKLSSTAYTKISFKIQPNQIPVNLYGTTDEYKFMPDIGEFVNDAGILCALRTPTADSLITDTTREGLATVQELHDTIFRIPLGAQIVDIDVMINRRKKVKTPLSIFAQAQKYRDLINKHLILIWESYQTAKDAKLEITPAFNTLVTRAISGLLADGAKIPGYNRRNDITLVKKKEAIEFMYITVTYSHVNHIQRGFKLTGRHGNQESLWAS